MTKTEADDVTWLATLHKELTEYVPPTGKGYGFTKVRRRITDAEWALVQQLVVKNRLVCAPFNAGMGFNFGIAIYATPTYPGLDCEHLLTLEGEHFGLRFKDAWEKLSPVTHNDANAALLARYEFKPLEDEGHYAY